MDDFKDYIVSGDSSLVPSDRQLDRLVERYPWFTTARIVRSWKRGTDDPVVNITLTGKPMPRLFLKQVAPATKGATVKIIDGFLSAGEPSESAGNMTPAPAAAAPRPAPRKEKPASPRPGPKAAEEDAGPDLAARSSMVLSDDDDRDSISEELAEIFLAQGFTRQALGIYRKLSLLYPEKSVYFAEIIDRIKKHK
ncbi:hypothetical protein FACS1894159_05070 [Bacteroidia bacterium]|nr:hypothetical protein FACS1894159_05070 [Bacteroidia bacterium]